MEEQGKRGYNHQKGGTLSPNPTELEQQYFFVCTFTILGKLAKADGRICEKEIRKIEHLMDEVLELGAEERSFAVKLFRASKDDSQGYEVYAEQFFDIFGDRQDILENLLGQMVLLLRIIFSKKIIENISDNFWIFSEHLKAFFPFTVKRKTTKEL